MENDPSMAVFMTLATSLRSVDTDIFSASCSALIPGGCGIPLSRSPV